ncbi:MAG: ABC transporter substrate-binding protein [Bacteriovoracaceae bacterium]
MTEESVETLYLIGKLDLVVGVSAYVKRPTHAREIETISAFTHANIKKIKALKPDLILGFSDIQQDIAKTLIGEGLNVFISNQRSLDEILNYIVLLSSMVGEANKGIALREAFLIKIEKTKKQNLDKKPKVYFEEWNDPLISAIKWVSELITICGGEDIFSTISNGVKAKDRFITEQDIIDKNPDIILGCWCGKKVDIDSIKNRKDFHKINAVKNNRVFELEPEIYLQPGPALFVDGLDQLSKLLN